MIFYSEEKGHYSHMVRLVLAEKDISCEIKEFDPAEKLPEELKERILTIFLKMPKVIFLIKNLK